MVLFPQINSFDSMVTYSNKPTQFVFTFTWITWMYRYHINDCWKLSRMQNTLLVSSLPIFVDPLLLLGFPKNIMLWILFQNLSYLFVRNGCLHLTVRFLSDISPYAILRFIFVVLGTSSVLRRTHKLEPPLRVYLLCMLIPC